VKLQSPPLSYHILQAAGLSEHSHSTDETMGKISLKHAFEIAKYHAQDEWYISRDLTERDIIPMIITEARKVGVQAWLENMYILTPRDNFKYNLS